MIHPCASSAGGSIVERLIAWYFRLNWVNVSKDAACAGLCRRAACEHTGMVFLLERRAR